MAIHFRGFICSRHLGNWYYPNKTGFARKSMARMPRLIGCVDRLLVIQKLIQLSLWLWKKYDEAC
jgi:hypothetical protein